MARIILQDGTETTDLSKIQQRLTHIGITLKSWPAPSGERTGALLDQKMVTGSRFP